MQFQGRAMASRSQDQIELPAQTREVVSANGRFRLVIEALDRWQPLGAQASLQHLQGGVAATVWAQPIPQQLGPRGALVADDGRVLMIDERINVRSRYALMLFNTQGSVVATHDFDALMRAAQASNDDIKAHARNGTWMGLPATLAAGSTVAHVPFAGRVLAVSLANGSLSIVR